jgi:hypothetical protein
MTSARQFMSSKRWFNDLRKVLQNLEMSMHFATPPWMTRAANGYAK